MGVGTGQLTNRTRDGINEAEERRTPLYALR